MGNIRKTKYETLLIYSKQGIFDYAIGNEGALLGYLVFEQPNSPHIIS